MKCLIILFYFISLVIVSFCDEKLFIHMVKDILEYKKYPDTLSISLCNKEDTFELFKMFSKTGYQINAIPRNVSSLPYPFPPMQTVFIMELQCERSLEILKMAEKSELFASPLKWLLYYDQIQQPIEKILNKYFVNLNILIDSDVTLAGLTADKTYIINKIFSRRGNTPLKIEYIGYWNEKEKFVDMEFEPITARRRQNFEGTTLKTCIVITHNDSMNHLTDKRDRHIDSIAKVNYVLVNHLSDIINATLQYSIESTWGYKDNNSRWSGMIGELTRKEADIGGTALFLTTDRVSIIDYIAMTTETRSKFVFRQPKLSYVTNVFTLPFDIDVWYSTIALIIITSMVLFVVVKWEWYKKKYVKLTVHSNETELRDSWTDILFLSYGALCQQGSSAIPFGFPGRITTIFLFISLMFLYTSYSANIVALLQSSSRSIQTLEDLLKSRLQVGVDDTVFNHFYFPNATEPIRKAIYLQKVAPPGQKPIFIQIDEGVRKLREGLFAFHVETGAGYKIVGETFHEDEKCGLQEIQYLQVPDPWLAIQKNSSFKESLKIGLRIIQESGLQYREHRLIYSRKPECISRGTSFVSVGLVDCYSALVILSSGLVLSFLMYLIEVYMHYRVKKCYAIKNCLFSHNQHERKP